MDLRQWRERSAAVWGTGDYEPTSRQLEPASEALVESLGISAGHDVLDVAAGHGNCALAAARRGARVTATDFSPAMLEAGRRRSQSAGVNVQWQEADAADLPFADGSFDRVTSVFGAIFALEQEQAAAEAVRVLRTGGRFGMTAWTPDGLTASTIAVGRRYGPPPPPGAPDPFRWGDPDEAAAIFAPFGCAVDVRRRTITFRYASWEDWAAATEGHGYAVVARQTMPAEAYAQMRDEMRAAVAAHNHAMDGGVAYDSDYVELLVTKP